MFTGVNLLLLLLLLFLLFLLVPVTELAKTRFDAGRDESGPSKRKFGRGWESKRGWTRRSTLRWPMPRSLETSRFRVDDHVNEIKGKGGGKDRRKVFVRFFFGNGIRTFMFSLGNLTSGWNAREEEKTRHPAYRIHQNSVGEIAPLSPGGKSARKIRGSWPRSGGRERCADCTEISKSHSHLGYPLAASGQTFKSASPAPLEEENASCGHVLSPPL